ncbi:helix-turn-helix transcriptional regulator [Pseudomonas viridiflava]|uniref:helix-turn-helix domain-containing protein n=1 Tax=Pseudomonas viridiflava TaxID=33069 RepID=UPI002E9D5C18|nr:helix-turn-helix transcriptional regulator [Pseudomonas viridiflava]
MELKSAFARALRHVRTQRHLTQEDFSISSSRTNISLLERAKTIPTLEKLEHLCVVLNVHPMTLMALCYAAKEGISVETLIGGVLAEAQEFEVAMDPSGFSGMPSTSAQ